jgi:hypothetical protein
MLSIPHNYFQKIMFKKVVVDQSQDFNLSYLEIDPEDGPSYPLLEYVDFAVRQVGEITPTEANYPRKSEVIQNKLDGLVASTSGYRWLSRAWPISVFISEDKEEQFDHRHLLLALKENDWRTAPVARYRRKVTGDALLDSLSDSSVMTLSGIFVNATDGGNPQNCSSADFLILSRVMEDEGIPRTKKNLEKLFSVSGIYEHFPLKGHKSTIGTIRNKILSNEKPSQRVFNTSKVEIKDWYEKNELFGENNYSSVDGARTRHKVLDNSFTYRYANDILKWAFEAVLAGETVRVSCASKATCEHEIEAERQEIVDAINDILNSTINWYISKVEGMLNVGSLFSFKLPKVDVNSLPLELYWIPQIEGEEEAIRVSF